MTFEDIKKANESIKTTDIKGKEYAEVNQRIKAFRMNYPQGFIETTLLSVENGVCIMKAEVGYYENGERRILSTGTAYEKEDSSYINKTSYIENCETSACGRALGLAGYGIDTSVASFEEVSNAILNQGDNEPFRGLNPNDPATAKQIGAILKAYDGKDDKLVLLMQQYKVKDIDDLKMSQASDILRKLAAKGWKA